jgi:hypothetical protein
MLDQPNAFASSPPPDPVFIEVSLGIWINKQQIVSVWVGDRDLLFLSTSNGSQFSVTMNRALITGMLPYDPSNRANHPTR